MTETVLWFGRVLLDTLQRMSRRCVQNATRLQSDLLLGISARATIKLTHRDYIQQEACR